MDEKKEKEKPSRLWMINTRGKPDAALTLMTVAFVLCCLMAIAGVIEVLTIGTFSITMRAFDMGFASVVLIPLISLYFGRRWNENSVSLKETQILSVEVEKARSKKKVLTEEVPDEGGE